MTHESILGDENVTPRNEQGEWNIFWLKRHNRALEELQRITELPFPSAEELDAMNAEETLAFVAEHHRNTGHFADVSKEVETARAEFVRAMLTPDEELRPEGR